MGLLEESYSENKGIINEWLLNDSVVDDISWRLQLKNNNLEQTKDVYVGNLTQGKC